MNDVVMSLLHRVLPVATFLLAITAVAELADRAGVFDVAAHRIARWGRGRVGLLWVLFAFFAVTCTIFLSLDTTAVLLTPVALALAAQIGVAPRPFALTTLWIANTGSLFLPVSNLTNLLAVDRMAGFGVDHGGYLRLSLAPALAAVVATLALLALLHRRDLAERYDVAIPDTEHDRVLLVVASVVCLVIGPAFAAGAPPWAVALVALAVLGVTALIRDRRILAHLDLPWAMAAGFAILTAAVTWAHGAGLLTGLLGLTGRGTSWMDLARLAGVAAVTSNAVDNLPAYLVLEPAAGDATRLMAVLIGTNAGPLVTPWGSLATLLWLQRCRAAGVNWRLGRLAALGAVCSIVAVLAAVGALSLIG